MKDNHINQTIAIGTLVLAAFAILAWSDARKSSSTEQRAYVYVRPGDVFNIGGVHGLQSYTFIGNSGRTFARVTEIRVGMKISDLELPEKLDQLGELKLEPGKPVIPPRVDLKFIRTNDKIEEEQRITIDSPNPTQAIYIYGYVNYKDIFDNDHKTSFCHYYNGTEKDNYISGFDTNNRPIMLPKYNSSQVKYCEKFNDAD